jgi:hypothetical protein
MSLTSYEKIPDSPQHWGLDERGFRALTKVRWVVTEKIHGANFCIVVHKDTIRCANRREFLSPGDPFYGYQRVLARLRGQVLETATLATQDRENSTASIYGELFGGSYPHPTLRPSLYRRASSIIRSRYPDTDIETHPEKTGASAATPC